MSYLMVRPRSLDLTAKQQGNSQRNTPLSLHFIIPPFTKHADFPTMRAHISAQLRALSEHRTCEFWSWLSQAARQTARQGPVFEAGSAIAIFSGEDFVGN